MRKIKIRSLIVISMALPIALFNITSVAEAYTTQTVLGSGIYTGSISVSTNGKYVAFTSSNATLVATDTNSKADAFLKDMSTGSVLLLSMTPSGDSGNKNTNNNVIITGNGRYALFNSEATNLSSTPGGYGENLYLRDIHNSTTTLISKAGDGISTDNYPVGISEDGRFVYYSSFNNGHRLYSFDRKLNHSERIDKSIAGVFGNGGFNGGSNVLQKRVSCDGRYVVISSSSTNLVEEDTNGVNDIFLIDRMNGHSISNITVSANDSSSEPKVSCDGNYILFESKASNLVANDTNNNPDLFRYSTATEVTEMVSLKNDESQYSGYNTTDSGAVGTYYDMSTDGRYIFFQRQQRFTGTDRDYLTMRDTEAGATIDIANSGSNNFPSNPVSSYDGRKVYYSNKNSVNGGKVLKIVTDHL